MDTFVCHPERGGPHPPVLFFMDAPGIREELRGMARRLAAAGYFVLLPNLYYRSGLTDLGPVPTGPDDPAFDRMVQLMRTLTISMVMQDAQALMSFIDRHPGAARGKLGCVGYCMSGQYAISAAAHFPERIAAAASFYGTRLMTDQPDSPHLAARSAKAELYIACAEIDHWMPPEKVAALSAALAADGLRDIVEIYPQVEHGFAFPERSAYDKAAAEKHWDRLLSLFHRRLQQ